MNGDHRRGELSHRTGENTNREMGNHARKGSIQSLANNRMIL